MNCSFGKKIIAMYLLLFVFLLSGIRVFADPIADNVSSTGDDNLSDWNDEWNIVSGKCGSDIEWILDTSTGELKISGSGEMWSRTVYPEKFWNAGEVKSVSFEGSITSIGAEAFSASAQMTSVKMPASVRRIGKSAFEGCVLLGRVDIAGDLSVIGDRCFEGCPNLTDIYCVGSQNEWE